MLQKLAENMNDDQKVRALRVARYLQVAFVFVVLFGSGSVTGYWMRDGEAREDRLEMRRAHLEELERTTDAYRTSLRYITGKVEQAAATVESVASTVESVASTADHAAKTAETAATRSKQAVQQANKVPEPSRDQINRSVQRANNAIKQ